MFKTEEEMSIRFEEFLQTNYGDAYLKEYRGLFGIPDFIYFVKESDEIAIVSFELKLKNWKCAAEQAFRYKSFSNITYVVLDSKNIRPALQNINVFQKYEIGLANFTQCGKLNILFKPKKDKPYSDNLFQKLIKTLNEVNATAKALAYETFIG